MISFVRGILSDISENRIEVDTGALGYEIFVTSRFLDSGYSAGSSVEIFTYMNVKEDEISLFGFETKEELRVFKKLITVSGVGPKGALGILSFLTPEELQMAILAGDAKMISKSPGIGSKTAEKIIIELKDKVSVEDAFKEYSREIRNENSEGEMNPKKEALMALTSLGFSNSEALRAMKDLDVKGKDVSQILQEALQKLQS